MENLWDELERRVKKHQPKNLEELELQLTQEWNNIELSVLEKLVDSVASRLYECVKMNCVSLSVGIIFRSSKFMCIFSLFRKIKIERNAKLKLIAYILGITCYKMSLIEVPKLLSIKQKRKKGAVEGERIIFDPLYICITDDQKVFIQNKISYFSSVRNVYFASFIHKIHTI